MPIISTLRHQLESIDIDGLRESANTVVRDPRSWAVAAATVVTYKLVQFYWNRRNYPPGPFPLPLIGNMLSLRKPDHVHNTIAEFAKTYGPVFTLYFGTLPNVFITDLEPAQEAFRDRKTDFAGRQQFYINKLFLGDKGTDVFMADYGREWEVLRRVAYAAVRKYAVHEQLPKLIADIVDEVVDTIKKNHSSKPFDIEDYLFLMTFNVLAQISYGEKYSIADEEFLHLVNINKATNENTNEMMVGEFLPPMRFVYRKTFNKIASSQGQFREFTMSKYQLHLKTYKPEVVRNFCDCLIAAKFEAEDENRDSVEQLNDDNIGLPLLDLFIGGSDSTRITLRWIVLIMASYPDIQQKLRDEIDNVVGVDKVIDHDQKSNLHYVQAYVSEVLRCRPVAPMGLPHKATVDSSIAGHPVPKGTSVQVLQYAIQHDTRHWVRPEEFRPERFLNENGKHNSRVPGFVPFGVGRRACLGEKLAVTDLVLMTCRLLQATRGYEIALPDGPGSVSLYGDTSIPMPFTPNQYNVMLRPKA